jgi:hypothetical protein
MFLKTGIWISLYFLFFTSLTNIHTSSAGPFQFYQLNSIQIPFIHSSTDNMQFSSLFLSLVLATAVVAKGDKGDSEKNGTTKAVTDKSLCKEMASLNQLVKLASNETKLADKTKNNATKIADIQAKASDASTKLTTMSSNATLVSTCATIDAAAKTEDECKSMKSLQKLVTLAGNDTALADKAKNNQTKIAAIQAMASKAQTKLDAMTSNTTLTTACDAIKTSKASKNGMYNSWMELVNQC